ncbi:hypothetical protein KSB_44330 [Ktedonobacter robiniae]|uniref:Uncharacterized protein n=1 Tax=Ktedonobacter robiniae TaxID=2778365 RepID=A0ABQ3UTD8_9CHLR|nr:hypothetical protein KSB_44330 [Ktedonobacter robiniae]
MAVGIMNMCMDESNPLTPNSSGAILPKFGILLFIEYICAKKECGHASRDSLRRLSLEAWPHSLPLDRNAYLSSEERTRYVFVVSSL